MALITNLLAYTEEGESYPEYISINVEGGTATVTARGAAGRDGRAGHTVEIKLGRKQLGKLLQGAIDELVRADARGQ